MRAYPTRASRRLTVAVAAAGLLVTGWAVPAFGAPTTACVDDVAGDTLRHEDDAPAPDDRADILKACVSSGPKFTFFIGVDRVTDPTTDPGWQRATFIGWFIDTDGDAEAEFFLDYSLDPGTAAEAAAVKADVKDIRGTDDVKICEIDGQVTDTGYAVSGLDASCLDGATTVQASPAMYYDRGEDDGGVVYDTISEELPELEQTGPRPTDRLAGADRTGTSVAISQARFRPGEAATAYLARGDVFADAAVAGVLIDGPILVVPSCGDAPKIVLDEIDRLGVDNVTALGQTQAICENMLGTAARNRERNRIGGADRFETSAMIATTAWRPEAVSPDRVYLARSDLFVDAVTGGTLPDGPIVLVPQCGDIPTSVRTAIDELDPGAVIALGGEHAVCGATLLAAAGGRPSGRLAGDTRYTTAIAIGRHAYPDPSLATTVYLARADLVVDALAGGILVNGPILIVDTCGDLNDPTLAPVAGEITRFGPQRIVALGGPTAICDETLTQAGGF